MQTPSTANATRERHPARSAHDTGFRRASHALSHRERAHMPPAPHSASKCYTVKRERRAATFARAKAHHTTDEIVPARHAYAHPAGDAAAHARRSHASRRGKQTRPPASGARGQRRVSYQTATTRRSASQCPAPESQDDTQPCSGTCRCRTPPPVRQRMSRYPTNQGSASYTCLRRSCR